MPIINKLSAAVPTSLVYITLGTLIDIWTIVWLVFNAPETQMGYFWTVGFLFTGLALLVIGLFLGQIGRAARHAELPPNEVVAAARAQQPIVTAPLATPVPPNSAAPMVATSPGQPEAPQPSAGGAVVRT